MNKIIVIGSSNLDMIIKTSKLPKPGETIGNGLFKKANGGKGANQAVAAARAGGEVTFVSCLGDDDFSTIMISDFKSDRIHTEYIFIDPNVATGIALIMVDENAENCIAVAPGANYKLSPELISQAESVIKDSDIILLQFEIPLQSVLFAIELARKHGKRILLNPAPAMPMDENHLAMIHTLVLNESEAEMLTGLILNDEEEIRSVAGLLFSKGPENIVITLGSKGAFVKNNEKGIFIEGYQVEAIDTTAAGDVYCGNLAVALAEGKSIFEAVKFASAASAISVTRMGAQPSAPERMETIQFLKSHE